MAQHALMMLLEKRGAVDARAHVAAGDSVQPDECLGQQCVVSLAPLFQLRQQAVGSRGTPAQNFQQDDALGSMGCMVEGLQGFDQLPQLPQSRPRLPPMSGARRIGYRAEEPTQL